MLQVELEASPPHLLVLVRVAVMYVTSCQTVNCNSALPFNYIMTLQLCSTAHDNLDYAYLACTALLSLSQQLPAVKRTACMVVGCPGVSNPSGILS